MEAIAKYDFKATADDELSFKRGEVLKVNAVFVFKIKCHHSVPTPTAAMDMTLKDMCGIDSITTQHSFSRDQSVMGETVSSFQ